MAYYTTTQTFPSADGAYNHGTKAHRLSVVANGGSVTIETAVDATTWVEALVVSADSDQDILVSSRRLRITPAGGAVYNFGPGLGAG